MWQTEWPQQVHLFDEIVRQAQESQVRKATRAIRAKESARFDHGYVVAGQIERLELSSHCVVNVVGQKRADNGVARQVHLFERFQTLELFERVAKRREQVRAQVDRVSVLVRAQLIERYLCVHVGRQVDLGVLGGQAVVDDRKSAVETLGCCGLVNKTTTTSRAQVDLAHCLTIDLMTIVLVDDAPIVRAQRQRVLVGHAVRVQLGRVGVLDDGDDEKAHCCDHIAVQPHFLIICKSTNKTNKQNN